VKTPKGVRSTLAPPRLVADEPEYEPPKLEKPLRLFFIGKVPLPPSKPRVKGKGGE